MTSTSDTITNDKQEDFSPEEIESKMLDGSTVRCFPTVKRTFRQKQCNWRWRWKYFTRALQPISEQGENTKDDASKVDENDTNLSANGYNENNLESSEVNEEEYLESNNEDLGNSCNKNKCNEETQHPVKSKEDYSACIKLIEKFQEAVLDNAVRVIQAAFKRFRERRQFLKLRKAATVIQRSVRHWLKRKHSCERPDCHLGIEGRCEQNNEMQRNCLPSDELERKVAFDDVESGIEEKSGLMDESHKDLVNNHEGLAEDKDGLSELVSERTDQFENSFDSLDTSSLSGSTDNISDAGVCDDQSEVNSPTGDPDSLSLADSGIDMYLDVPIETAIADDCKYSTRENSLPNTSEETISELQ